jgi:uncharacterized membrane protein
MDRAFFVLLGLGALVVLAATGVVAWIAHFRAGAIGPLTKRIASLERALAELRSAPSADGPAPSSRPEPPASVQPVAPSAAPASEPFLPPPPLAPPIAVSAAAPIELPPPRPVAPEPMIAAATSEPTRPQSLPSPKPAMPSIDWERWIGVRGAAWLGGIVLAFAALLFFQYSIQRGWITPALRCSFGAVFGIAAVATSSILRRRDYRVAPDAIAGAGVTTLYGATWAAHRLYDLLPLWMAFAAMVAVTALCVALALRHSSQAIAVFGLLGGFATPLVLSQGAEDPIGLFSYLLLLDGALLALGRRKNWPLIATLASIATSLVFLAWIVVHGVGGHRDTQLGFCAVTAALFAASGNVSAQSHRRLWLASQASSIVASFAFALYFAANAQLDRHFAPIAVLLAVLEVAAVWIALKQRAAPFGLAAAVGATATLIVWMVTTEVDVALAWEAAASTAVLALIVHVGREIEAHRATGRSLALPAAATAIGLGAATILGAASCTAVPLWPSLCAACVLAFLLTRQAHVGSHAALQLVAAVGLAVVFVAWRDVRGQLESISPTVEFPPGAWLEATIVGALAFIWLVRAVLWPSGALRTWAFRACCAASGVLLLERAVLDDTPQVDGVAVAVAVLVLAVCGYAASASLGSTVTFALVACAAWISEVRYASMHFAREEVTATWLAACAATWALGSCLPLLSRAPFGAQRSAWRVAAIACVAWALPIEDLVDMVFARAPDSTTFIAGTLLAGGIALALRATRFERDASGRATPRAVGFAWFGAVCGAYASFAVAFECDHAIDLVGVALTVFACAALSRHLKHAGLFWCALAGAAFVAIRVPIELARAAFESSLYVRSGLPVAHWLSYSIGVPALALLAASRMSSGPERRGLLARGASAVALVGCLALFAWLNVEVINHFSAGDRYDFSYTGTPARDLTMSVAWAVFALGLLVFGVRTKSVSSRWTSLAFFLATIAKVFLYDLRFLHGLSRVGSLVGLAFALLAVSLLYQRFVFRREPSPEPSPEASPAPNPEPPPQP